MLERRVGFLSRGLHSAFDYLIPKIILLSPLLLTYFELIAQISYHNLSVAKYVIHSLL